MSGGVDGAVRTLVIWCPDWPVAAAGVPADVAAAVFVANRATAVSPAARAEGVRSGMRRREAQRRCPDLEVVPDDPLRDARAFEPVVAAAETLTPRVEVHEPGRCSFPTRGPSRYHGGDHPLVARTTAAVAGVLGAGRARVGIAAGPFAATLAARAGVVVEPGETPAFLAPLPVAALARPDLAGLLVRLGLRTLGAFAALPEAHVTGRFGADGALAHRLARGLDPQPPATRRPPPDLVAQSELDPPAEQVEQVAFVAKALADDLHERLARLGLACTRIAVEAETEHGESLSRLWRHEGALTPAGIAQRARWQLEGWLAGSSPERERPTAGLVVLRLVPDQVVPASGRQLGFWGSDAAAAERAGRALARVQGLLGAESVTLPRLRGGRSPGEQVEHLPVFPGDLDGVSELHHPFAPPAPAAADAGPWPGRVPAPSPALVHPAPIPAEVIDRRQQPVGVTGRGQISAAPARLSVSGGRWTEIVAWAGPWPADERWWDPQGHRRRARCQVVAADGRAHLLTLEAGRWSVEATYD